MQIFCRSQFFTMKRLLEAKYANSALLLDDK